MLRPLFIRIFALLLSLLLFTSCGGGTGTTIAGIGGTGITASGSITGFGSIYVNGIHFDITSANIYVNGVKTTEANLKLGMVVTVKGTLNSNGVDGTAASVDYKTELQGPISSSITTGTDGVSKTFTVLGRTVLIKDNDTIFDGFTFATIAPNDVVAISGFIDANTQLVATHITKVGTTSTTSAVEVKGTVSNHNSGSNQFDITIGSNTYTVQYSTVNISITNGLSVRVKGSLFGNTITAIPDGIELESDPFENVSSSEKVSVEGIVSNLDTTAKTFTVNGQAVDYSGVTVPSGLNLADGAHIEVEGYIVGNVLQVSQFEEREGELRINALVQSVDVVNNTVSLMLHPGATVTVKIDNLTEMEDETGVVSRMKISDLAAGDYLVIEAHGSASPYTAKSIHRKTLDTGSSFIIQAPVDSFTSTAGSESVTVLGITFTTDSQTKYQIDDATTSQTSFFGAISTGSTVRIKDNQSSGVSDGVATEMDLKN